MLVLSVAYPLFPVSADAAGGAEQILFLLERGLVAAGHRSLVIAAKGSSVSGELIASAAPGATITEDDRSVAQQEHLRLIQSTIRAHPVDLIHYHGLDFDSYYSGSSTVPAIATLHLPPSWYASEIFSLPNVEYVCVSHSQAATLPQGCVPAIIGNGVDPIGIGASPTREYLLWLGRICPEKGPDIALRVAHRLQLPLLLAGPVHGFASHQQFFNERVAPLLDEQRVYIGPVGRARKITLLQNAKALLVPSLAPETSSLVAMEAITAGTPVVALSAGALPEVVQHGVTGFVVHSEEAMAEAVFKLQELTPHPELYSADRMVQQYLQLYERVIRKRHLDVATAPNEAL